MKIKTYISEELRQSFILDRDRVRHFNPNLQVKRYSNAIVLPSRGWDEGCGGVVSEEGNFVPYSAWKQFEEKIYNYSNSDVLIRHEEVFYLGTLNNIWGHALTDNMRHIWALNRYKTQKCVYVTVDNKPLNESAVELLSMAGVDMSNVEHIVSLTQFDAIYVPDDCIVNVKYGMLWSLEYKRIIETIKTNASLLQPIDSPKKIYFTRTQLPQSTRDIGEWHIEKVFKILGYSIIAPEKFSVIEQIQMLMNCDCFAATEGSVAHNAVFLSPQTKITLILKAPWFNQYQWMINDMVGFDEVVYVEAQKTSNVLPQNPFYGPFLMQKTIYLCQYAGIKYHGISCSRWLDEITYRCRLLARVRKKIRVLYTNRFRT